jgi:enoyl-CoA hydratase
MTAHMDSEPIKTEVRESVLIVTLNRPEVKNAIDSSLTQGLRAAIDRLDSDDALRVGVLVGAGGTFCSGMDLKAFGREGAPKGLARLLMEGADKILIAAVEGYALAGGLELALMCDLIVSAENAKFGVPESKSGLLAAGGALIRLPRRIPQGVAMQMAVTGEPIDAVVAHSFGLVNQLATCGRSLEVAEVLAEEIASNAPLSVMTSKSLIREMASMSEADAWAWQRPLSKMIFESDDASEGARAFKEKRTPVWKGR